MGNAGGGGSFGGNTITASVNAPTTNIIFSNNRIGMAIIPFIEAFALK